MLPSRPLLAGYHLLVVAVMHGDMHMRQARGRSLCPVTQYARQRQTLCTSCLALPRLPIPAVQANRTGSAMFLILCPQRLGSVHRSADWGGKC